MRLIDTIKCVVCGQLEYALAKGKSARMQNGVCGECMPGLKEINEKAKNVAASQPASVSKRS